jgi:hypothetical protein
MTVASAYALFESSTEAEARGVWVSVGPFQFKLARAGGGNDAFTKEATKRFKPFQVAISNETMPEDMAKDMVVDIFVDTVVLDWKNVGDRDGNELPFSKDAARKLFKDLPNLFTEVQAQATKTGNFRKENLEAAAGN